MYAIIALNTTIGGIMIQFISDVNNGMYKAELATKYNVNERTIGRWAIKHGLCLVKGKPGPKRIYTLNEEYFNEIDSEYKAYILGFIITDGSITSDNRSMNITLQQKDVDILEKIRTQLESNVPFVIRQEKYISFTVSSVKLINSLHKYGIVINKTLNVPFPIINHNLIPHLMRGIIDGDGYIGKNTVVITSGSIPLLSGIQEYTLNQYNEYRPIVKVKTRANTYRIAFGKRHTNIIQDFYKYSNIYLNRKFESYDKHFAYHNK